MLRSLTLASVLAACAAPAPVGAPAATADTAADTTGAPEAPAVDEDLDGHPVGEDCDDHDDDVHPGAPELCDGIDSDCDGVDDAQDDVVDGLPFYEDADGDGFGVAVVTACALADGFALVGGDCDDANADISPGAAELCDEIDQDCDGASSDAVASSPDCAVPTCADVLDVVGPGADGAYWLTLGGATATSTWCDLTTDGGGWTLGFLRNTASTGNQGGFGGVPVAPELLDTSPQAASGSATPRLGWHDLESFDWDELVVGAYYQGGETYRSRTILRDELRIAFGDDGYLLYGGLSGYYWCGGDAAFTDSGVGGVNKPPGTPYTDCKGHGLLGSGWDFSESDVGNTGLTLCGADGSNWMYAAWASTLVSYGVPGGAQAIWVR